MHPASDALLTTMPQTHTSSRTTHPPNALYVLLVLVSVLGLSYSGLGGFYSFRNLMNGTDLAGVPFHSGSLARIIRLSPDQARIAGVPKGFSLDTLTYVSPEAQAAGLSTGDAVDTVAGQPFTGNRVLFDAIESMHPGDPLALTVWHHGTSLDEPPAPLTIRLGPERTTAPRPQEWLVRVALFFLPVFCLLTGLYVVFARPGSLNAWLILGMLGYFHGVFINPSRHGPTLVHMAFLWNDVVQAAMPISFMLFGANFPERSQLDRRFPWVKWILIVPAVLVFPLDALSDYASMFHFSLLAPFQEHHVPLNNLENIWAAISISFGFACLYATEGQKTITPDARRRLRILIAGCSVGLIPFFLLLLYSLIRGFDLGTGIPGWLSLSVFIILFAFPLTLAYVVIVQRAMDVRILLRQGTKYFFAKQSILALGVILASLMSYEISLATIHHGHRGPTDVARLFIIIGIFIIYRRVGAIRMQKWIDQKFFREAYSAEQVLSELSEEARNFTETVPLIETIANRLKSTLHIDRIAVFLLSGDSFQLRFATGLPIDPGYLPALASSSTTITNLSRPRAKPANVYRDDPNSWLVDATDAERTALADLSTELLVPLPGRNRLIGVIALGPKSSEEPYSKIDRQLLQTVASQTGLALENAELLKRLTTELAQQASLHREIEIAREVQERLFPQSYPKVEGIDLCGYCRPAQFVGGDYYDFFLIPQSFSTPEAPAYRLALAIGDISGKGISAALLMASLRASLRSVAMLQQPDGSGNGHLANLMKHVNHLVYEASTTNRYATFFYAELDPATRMLTYVNAGHNCPVILRGLEAIELKATGTVVGLLAGVDYEQASIQMEPGDTLLAFTDGISEAMTAEDEEWGEARMVAAAQRLLGESATADSLLQRLLAEADAFTDGAKQHDDMTLTICRVA